jgi:hypothetical protein
VLSANPLGSTLRRVGDWASWWTIGIDVGFGVALGVLFAGIAGGRRLVVAVAFLLAAAAAAVIGLLVWRWDNAVGGIAGALVGAAAGGQVVAGARRRGGTHAGLAVLVAGAALVVAALAVVPVVGYLEAIALPALAARLRRRSPDRYAGLRTLARD